MCTRVCIRCRTIGNHGAIAIGVWLRLVRLIFGGRVGRVVVPVRVRSANRAQGLASLVNGIGSAVVVVVGRGRVGEGMLMTRNVEWHNHKVEIGKIVVTISLTAVQWDVESREFVVAEKVLYERRVHLEAPRLFVQPPHTQPDLVLQPWVL